MISFVKDAEVSLERTPKDKISVDEGMYIIKICGLTYMIIIIMQVV